MRYEHLTKRLQLTVYVNDVGSVIASALHVNNFDCVSAQCLKPSELV